MASRSRSGLLDDDREAGRWSGYGPYSGGGPVLPLPLPMNDRSELEEASEPGVLSAEERRDFFEKYAPAGRGR
jgi:hypothetical protein